MKKQLLIVLLLCLNAAAAQEVYVKATAGRITVGNLVLTPDTKYKASMSARTELVIPRNAKALVFAEGKVTELGSVNAELKMKKADVLTAVRKMHASPGVADLYGFMVKAYKTKEADEVEGKSIGGIKGLEGDEKEKEEMTDVFFPADSSEVANDEPEFYWKIKRQMLSPQMLVIFNEADTIYKSQAAIPLDGKAKIKLTNPGVYHWIIKGKSKKEPPIEIMFTKLACVEAAQKKKRDAAFEKSLEFLSEEARIQILSDYNKLND